MARPKKIEAAHKTIYLPPVYDSKKFMEGIIEIINCVQNQRLKANEISDTLKDKEMPVSDD